MIIPIKCFTCGEVLANKYRYYLQEVKKVKIENNIETNKVTYLSKDQKVEKTPQGLVLDKLQLTKYCCRRHMLTHVDLE